MIVTYTISSERAWIWIDPEYFDSLRKAFNFNYTNCG
jgi:hypothetical protein